MAEGKSAGEIDERAKVRFEVSKVEIELKYPNASQIAYKALFNHFKAYDNFLRPAFHKYDNPPSLAQLKKIQTSLGNQSDNGMQYYVIEHINNLKRYFNDHLSGLLSRKVNHFIFELLYLFNILKYGGKVAGKNSNDYALSVNNSNPNKFNPYPALPKFKSRFITDMIANAGKRELRSVL